MCMLHSLDGHPLPIKQLKGMEAIEVIDLSGKGLTVLSAIVIGSLISSNSVTKTLKYAAPFAWPFSRQRPMTVDDTVLRFILLLTFDLWCVDSLARNMFDAEAAEHLADALKHNKALLELK